MNPLAPIRSRRFLPRVALCLTLVLPLTLPAVATLAAPTAPLHWQPLAEPGCGGWMTGLTVSPFDSNRMLVSGDMLGCGLSEDGGKSWLATTGFKSYEQAGFTWHPTDPNTVWLGTMSGPYVSHDAGHTWQERRAGMPAPAGIGYSAPVEKVLIDPNDPKHLLAIGGSSREWDSPGKPAWGAIWESRDAGDRWTKLTTLTATGASEAPDAKGINLRAATFAAGSSTRLYAANGEGFFVSDDGGKTWRETHAGLPHVKIERVVAHPRDRDTVFASLGRFRPGPGEAADVIPGGVYKSTDAGKTWTSISNGLSQKAGKDWNFTATYKGFAVAASNPDVMYANDGAWDTGVTYGTRDGGKSWRPLVTKGNIGQNSGNAAGSGAQQVRTAYPSGCSMTVAAVDPRDPDTVLTAGSESLLLSHDGGKSWQDATSDPVGADAWRGRGYSGLCSWQIRFDPFRPNVAVLQAMDAARAWVTTDGMKSWTLRLNQPSPWGGGHDSTFTRDGHVYATSGQYGFYGIGRSTDGGKTWTVLHGAEHGLPKLDSPGTPDGIYALPDDPMKVWTCIGGKLYATTDGGEHWTARKLDPWVQWIAADPRNPRRFYVSGVKNVYRTDDGETFTPVGGPHANGRVTVDSLGRLYVVARQAGRNGLWRMAADGRWSRLFDEPNLQGVAVDPTDPDRLAVTTNTDPYKDYTDATGVWLSADAGKTWTQANDGLAMLRGHVVAFNPHDPEQLVFGSFGRGYFTTRWPKTLKPAGTPRTYAAGNAEDDLRFAAADVSTEPPPKTIEVKNGAMTDGTTTPDNWSVVWTGKGKLEITRDTKTFRAGPASLHLASIDGPAQGQAGQMVDANAGAKFTIRGSVKCAGSAKVNVAVQAFTGSFSPISFQQAQYAQDNADWMDFSKEITLPEGTAHAAIVLLLEGEGEAWLDEVKITDAQGVL